MQLRGIRSIGAASGFYGVDGKVLLEALKQKLHLPAASVKMHNFLAFSAWQAGSLWAITRTKPVFPLYLQKPKMSIHSRRFSSDSSSRAVREIFFPSALYEEGRKAGNAVFRARKAQLLKNASATRRQKHRIAIQPAVYINAQGKRVETTFQGRCVNGKKTKGSRPSSNSTVTGSS